MKKDIFSTAKHTIIYSLGNVSIKAVGFILLPLYTSHLTVSDFGILGLLEAFMQFSIAVFSFKLPTAMMRWLAGEKDIKKQKSIIYTTFSTTIALLLPILILLILARDYLSVLFFDTNEYSYYFLIVIFTIFFEIILTLILNIIRTREKSFLYLFFTLSKVIISLFFVIYLVAKLKMGIEGVVLSQLISSATILLFSVPILYNNILIKYNFKIGKELFLYGFPLVFSTISTMILTLADRFYLKFFYNLSDVGIYNLSYKIASVINIIIIQSFQLGFLPIAFRKYEEGNAEIFFTKVMKYFSTVLMFSIVGISLFAKEIILLLSKNSDYYVAYYFVPVIALSFFIKGIHYNFSLSLHFVKKTKYNTIIVLTGAVVNLIMNFLFVPKYGIWGATTASIFAGIVILILFYKISQREYRIDYDIKRLVIITLIGIVFILTGYYLSTLDILISIILKISLLVIFPIILFFFGYFTYEEKQKFINLINKKIGLS